MLGWSISASACRSASKRASTCLGVHAGLDELEATVRLTGSVCWAIQTVPMPPSPISSTSLYLPARIEPTPSAGRGSGDSLEEGGTVASPAWAGIGGPGSRPGPSSSRSWAASRASTRARSVGSSAHSRSSRAGRSAAGMLSTARTGSLRSWRVLLDPISEKSARMASIIFGFLAERHDLEAWTFEGLGCVE